MENGLEDKLLKTYVNFINSLFEN